MCEEKSGNNRQLFLTILEFDTSIAGCQWFPKFPHYGTSMHCGNNNIDISRNMKQREA